MIADLIKHQKETVRQQFITYIKRAATEDFFPYGDLGRQLNGRDLLGTSRFLCRLISLDEWRDMRIDLYDMVGDVLTDLDENRWALDHDRDDDAADNDRELARMIGLAVDSLCRRVMMNRWGCDH